MFDRSQLESRTYDTMTALPHKSPHARIDTDSRKQRWVLRLWDRLWEDYRDKVPQVHIYETLMNSHHVDFTNDHIAFRTLACQQPCTGRDSITRLLDAIGYEPAGCYSFVDKHLTAIHYQHPHNAFPKIFVSELKTWELPDAAQKAITTTLNSHRTALRDELLVELFRLEDSDETVHQRLLDEVSEWFLRRPWHPPQRTDLESVDQVSQYAAWVLVHGYRVNHFTALINSHHAPKLDNIEKTAALLREAGITMKPEIEGEPGSRLRQTATNAAVIDVDVRNGDSDESIPWTYAYLELAERREYVDAQTGERSRFEGFLGPQATQLFEMTRR